MCKQARQEFIGNESVDRVARERSEHLARARGVVPGRVQECGAQRTRQILTYQPSVQRKCER